ncbi:copper amine oxidase N-terminal domain-containing protein [Paenibacillus sp. P26]|nr:copper amine oxidase N-terminal domain-containing protein [Paenibacillus sp. P26]UUZ90670.1 copper amine oxidase N-terminal domain-containing protein [Paenibacillus sp. P25]
MKADKICKTVVTTVLVGLLIFAGMGNVASANSGSQSDEITVLINGVKQNFPQPALMKDGSTLVPMRAVFEALGATIKWDQATQTVTATNGDTTIMLMIGKPTAFVNGKAVQLSVPGQIINESTYVPLRFVGEALGNKVGWDGDTYTVTIEKAADSGSGSVVQAPGQSNNGSGTVVQAPVGTHKSVRDSYVVAGLDIVYGNHTYGVKNQQEYNEVMKLAKEAVAKAKEQYKTVNDLPSGWVRYFNGERYTGEIGPNLNSSDYALVSADGAIGTLVKNGVTLQQLLTIYQASEAYGYLSKDVKASDEGDASPVSAYDHIVLKYSDCDAESQASSLVYDLLGVENTIIAGGNHADAYIKLGDVWFKKSTAGAAVGATKVNMDKVPASYWVISQPINYKITPGKGITGNK